MDNLSEEMTLAIEIIRQLENLDYPPETILQANGHNLSGYPEQAVRV